MGKQKMQQMICGYQSQVPTLELPMACTQQVFTSQNSVWRAQHRRFDLDLTLLSFDGLQASSKGHTEPLQRWSWGRSTPGSFWMASLHLQVWSGYLVLVCQSLPKAKPVNSGEPAPFSLGALALYLPPSKPASAHAALLCSLPSRGSAGLSLSSWGMVLACLRRMLFNKYFIYFMQHLLNVYWVLGTVGRKRSIKAMGAASLT